MPISGHKNFAISTLATPPSSTDGTSLVVASGHGALFPEAPFNVTVWPTAVQPTSSNAEIMRVTNKATDTFTVARAQEGTSGRTHLANAQIAATITARTLTDVEYGAHGVINVMDPAYGAVGDGVTDDRTAFQSAVESVADGATVFIVVSDGTFLLSSPLSIGTRNVTWWIHPTATVTAAMLAGNIIAYEAAGNIGIGIQDPTTKLHVSGGSVTVSDGGVRLRPPLDAASAWQLNGRDFGLPVPYFTPLTNNTAIAFDIFPQGTPADFDAGRIGVAWIDVCSTDIEADGTNYESIRVQKFKDGVAAINSAKGGTGTDRGLVLQLEGGNVGIGTGTTAPSSLLTLNSSTLTGIELQDTTVARGYFAIANAAGNWFTNSVDGDVVIRGMGGRILLGSNASTPAPTLVVDDGNTGNVGIGEDAPDYKLDVNGAIGFTPGASVTPVDNGDVVFELTNNTTLTIRAKGSDGTVRSGTVTLS
jgi:hypothetical protein